MESSWWPTPTLRARAGRFGGVEATGSGGGSGWSRWGGGRWVWGGEWEPFNFSPRVDAPMNIYTRVVPVGVSSLVDIEALAGHWRQFEDGTIGDAEFPDKTVQYRNPSVSPE